MDLWEPVLAVGREMCQDDFWIARASLETRWLPYDRAFLSHW